MKTSFVRGVIASSSRVEIDPLVLHGDANGHRAELQRVEDVARERRPGRHDLVARIERRHADVADDRIRARAHRHVLERDAAALGERLAQPPRATVRIAVEVDRRPRDRFLRRGKRAVRPLVRGELDDPLEPELALHLLHGLSGLVRDEPVERLPDRRRVAAGPRSRHVAGAGSGAVTYSPTISPSPFESKLDSSTASPCHAAEHDEENGGEEAGRDETERRRTPSCGNRSACGDACPARASRP